MATISDRGEPAWRPSVRLLDDLALAAVALDATGRVVYCNASAEALFGLRREELLGGAAHELLVEETELGALDEVLARVLSGSPWSGQLTMRCADGQAREVMTSWSPTYDGEEVVGALLLGEDSVSGLGAGPSADAEQSRRQARLQARRLSRLGTVSAELLASHSIDDVAAVVTEHLTDAAGATVGSISLLVDDETLALIAIRGGAEGVASRWATYPLSGHTPAAECVRTRRPLILESRDEIRSRYPDLEAAAEGERAILCLPLVAGERDLGVVTLSFPGRRRIDAAELAFMGLLSDMCAHAIDRIRAQDDAADREAKLSFLADATAKLSEDLDYEGTLAAVAEAAVPWFADWCAIALEDDGRLRTISVAHAHPESAYLVQELQTKYPARPDSPRGSYRVLRTGLSELVPEIGDELLSAAAQDEEHLRLMRMLNFRSALSCPLKVHDRVLGVITWVAGEHGRRFGPADRAFGEDLARRAAVAIDNAQLHSEMRDFALRLQQAVLPERLPALAEWDTSVVYLPAGRTDAGGDFYDVVELGDGRVAIFVGDVMGRGVAAASVMAQMRSAIRTVLALDPEPSRVMTALDQVFERLGLEHLVTAAYAVADPIAGVIQLISAGHPPPLLLRANGDLEIVRHASTMILGAGGGERERVTLPFGRGDTALLYTDGLVERRGEDADAGMDRLVKACVETPRTSLEEFLVRVVEEVRDPTRDDDVAALAVRRLH